MKGCRLASVHSSQPHMTDHTHPNNSGAVTSCRMPVNKLFNLHVRNPAMTVPNPDEILKTEREKKAVSDVRMGGNGGETHGRQSQGNGCSRLIGKNKL